MRNWIITYLLFSPLNIFAQADIKNTSLTNSNLAILYIGIENRITVSGFDDDTTLKLTSAQGQVLEFKWNNNPRLFFVKSGYTDTDTLRLYQENKLVLTRVYQVKKIGYPIPQLGDIVDTVATVQQILENPTLNVIIPDCSYDHRFQVLYFTVTFMQENGDILNTFERINGYQLKKAQTVTISNLKTGDKIVFTDIIATCHECALRRLNPFTITIK